MRSPFPIRHRIALRTKACINSSWSPLLAQRPFGPSTKGAACDIFAVWAVLSEGIWAGWERKRHSVCARPAIVGVLMAACLATATVGAQEEEAEKSFPLPVAPPTAAPPGATPAPAPKPVAPADTSGSDTPAPDAAPADTPAAGAPPTVLPLPPVPKPVQPTGSSAPNSAGAAADDSAQRPPPPPAPRDLTGPEQDVSASPAGRPSKVLPPPPPPRTGAYEHSGFLLHMGIGLGYGSLGIDTGAREISANGVTGGIELMIGGTPGASFVIGGALITHTLEQPALEFDGVESTEDSRLDAGALAVFANYYFDPKSNIYLQAIFGVASATWRFEAFEAAEPSGLVVAAGAGYGDWISEQWAISGLARLSYYSMADENSAGAESRYQLFAPTVSLVVQYH